MVNFLKYTFYIGSIIAAIIIALLVLLPNYLYKSIEDISTWILILFFVCLVWVLVASISAITARFKKATRKK